MESFKLRLKFTDLAKWEVGTVWFSADATRLHPGVDQHSLIQRCNVAAFLSETSANPFCGSLSAGVLLWPVSSSQPFRKSHVLKQMSPSPEGFRNTRVTNRRRGLVTSKVFKGIWSQFQNVLGYLNLILFRGHLISWKVSRIPIRCSWSPGQSPSPSVQPGGRLWQPVSIFLPGPSTDLSPSFSKL